MSHQRRSHGVPFRDVFLRGIVSMTAAWGGIVMKRQLLVVVLGAFVATGLAAVPASAANKVQVTCSDGTGYSVGAAATFGQDTANAAFNAANPLGIVCAIS